jgi:hypothetical protein
MSANCAAIYPGWRLLDSNQSERLSLMIGPKIAEGREAEVYAWNGDAAAVLKLYRPGYSGHIAEGAALTRLGIGGMAPRLIDALEIDGRHGLLLERLDGSDMLAMLERQPWRLLGYARTLAEAQIRIHNVQAPADLPDARQTLATRIDAAALRSQVHDFARRILDGLPAGDRLCHGDFIPATCWSAPIGGSVSSTGLTPHVVYPKQTTRERCCCLSRQTLCPAHR